MRGGPGTGASDETRKQGNEVDEMVEAEAPPVSIKEGEQQALDIPEGLKRVREEDEEVTGGAGMVEQVDSDDEGSKGEVRTR